MLPCQPFHRLFFALRPPRVAANDIAWRGPGTVGPDRLHVTLVLLDDWPVLPRELLAAMIEIGGTIGAAPFRIVFDEISGNGKSVVLRPSERLRALERFRDDVAAQIMRLGIPLRSGVRFSPHMTVAYRNWPGFTAWADPFSWRVEEFMLIESLVGWHEHREHGRWRLAA